MQQRRAAKVAFGDPMSAKKRRGRPTKYDPRAMPDQARKLCELGATDADLGEFFDVDRRTIHRWKQGHKEFREALKDGKRVADDQVERSLYLMAVGYCHPEDKIFLPAGANEPVIVPTVKRYPPDTTAAIFWLKNRKPAEWAGL